MRPLVILFFALVAAVASASTLESWVLSKVLKAFEEMSPAQRLDSVVAVAQVVKVQQSVAVVLNGVSRVKSDPADRFDTAVHEAAHAIAIVEAEEDLPRIWRLRRVKLCTGSTVGAAGWTKAAMGSKMRMPEATHLRALLRMQLAGRAAEAELLGRTSAGAAADIAAAKMLAKLFVCSFGFGSQGLASTLGPSSASLHEQRRLVARGYREARALVRQRRREIETLANALLVHEELSGARVRALLQSVRASPPPRRFFFFSRWTTTTTSQKKTPLVRDRLGRYKFRDETGLLPSSSAQGGDEGLSWWALSRRAIRAACAPLFSFSFGRDSNNNALLAPPAVVQQRVWLHELLRTNVQLRLVQSAWNVAIAALRYAAIQQRRRETTTTLVVSQAAKPPLTETLPVPKAAAAHPSYVARPAPTSKAPAPPKRLSGPAAL